MRKTRLFAIVIVVILCAGSSVLAEDAPRFDFRADLVGAHPEVFDYVPFAQWDQTHHLERWGESAAGDVDHRVVYTQEAGPIKSSEIFAMRVTQPEDGDARVLNHRVFSPAQVSKSYTAAKSALRTAKGIADEDIVAATPVPVVSADESTLHWRLRTRSTEAKMYIVDPAGAVHGVTEAIDSVQPHACMPGSEDARSMNDLHHPHDATVAVFATVNADGPRDIAYRLLRRVFKKIDYDMTDNIDVFTDSDTRILNRGSGMCDEKAVALVSALRANGIPARLKIIVWYRKGVEQAHACVEYLDENEWIHLDPTWSVVGAPSVYRNTRIDGEFVQKVRVIDIDWPDDARSTTLINDITGDGRLNPWEDFCYSPSKKGDEERPGYSN